jgi:hypothetical protein
MIKIRKKEKIYIYEEIAEHENVLFFDQDPDPDDADYKCGILYNKGTYYYISKNSIEIPGDGWRDMNFKKTKHTLFSILGDIGPFISYAGYRAYTVYDKDKNLYLLTDETQSELTIGNKLGIKYHYSDELRLNL